MRTVVLAASGLVGLAALADLWVAVRPGLAEVPPEVLAEAAAHIGAERRPGSLVVVSPLLGMPALAGLGDLEARPDLPSAEVRARRTVWLIDRDEAPMQGFGTPTAEHELREGVVIRRFEPTQTAEGLVVLDLLDLQGVRGQVADGTRVMPCTRPRAEGGLSCVGAADWMYLAPRKLNVDGRQVDCLWAHPPKSGRLELELEVPAEASPGHHFELELRSALDDGAVTQTADGASVQTAVRQGSARLGTVIRSNQIGWAERSFVVSAGQPVVLAVSAARDGRRHHCLDGRIIEKADTP